MSSDGHKQIANYFADNDVTLNTLRSLSRQLEYSLCISKSMARIESRHTDSRFVSFRLSSLFTIIIDEARLVAQYLKASYLNPGPVIFLSVHTQNCCELSLS